MRLTIKKETLFSRCEVCHKSDYYNADLNYCSRCSYMLNEAYKKSSKKDNWIINLGKNTAKVCLLGATFILGIVFSFYIFILPFSEYGWWPIDNYIIGFILFMCFICLPIVGVIFLGKTLYPNKLIGIAQKNVKNNDLLK